MSCDLLMALESMKYCKVGPTASHCDFQHKLRCDLESLIWVVVYAVMIHRRNLLASADPEMRELHNIKVLDRCWAAHAYGNILMSHDHMVMTGSAASRRSTVSLWFPDPREAAFFRDAMRLIRDQGDGDYITYESICKLFRDHISLAKTPQAFDVVSK